MRFRKLAGLVVGALTVGAMAGPGLVAPAQAAAQTTESYLSSVCKYSNYYADFRSDYDVVVDGTSVSVTFDKPFNPGATASNFSTIQFKTITPTMVLNVDGQAVTVHSDVAFADVAYGAEGAVMGNSDLGLGTLTGTLAEADDSVSSVSLTSMTIPMKISVNPAVQNVTGTMTCTPDKVATQDMTCSFGAFKMFYAVKAYTGIMNKPTGGSQANGQYVRTYLENPLVPGMPAFLSIDSQTSTLGLTVDGEALSFTGTETYSPALPGTASMPIAKLTSTRTATAALTASSVDSFATNLSVSGAGNAIPCVAYTPTETTTSNTGSSALTCIYGTFPGMSYDATTSTTYDHKDVSATLSDVTFGLIPSDFELRSVQVVASAKAGSTVVDLASSTKSYESPYPAGNAAITDLPELTGTSTSVLYPTATTIDLLTFNLMLKTPYGPTPSAAVIKCGLAAATATTVTATSTAANKVDLSAAVDKTAAPGKIAFYEGATKIGSDVTVASGVATATVTGVKAGEHTYTAKFTPTEQFRYQVSTSAGSTATVSGVATATSLVASPAGPAAASLAATVTPATAGTVEFYEGATKVGEVAATDGAATLALTELASGAHTYTAKFVPTDLDFFVGSTSAASTVTVAPSVACTNATASEKAAAAKVKTATTKSKAAAAKVKTATAKVSKAKKIKGAKGKKALKAAQAQLKTAKAQSAAATKALTAAKKALATATASVKAQC
ncbi:hypothetical protein GCM10009795_010610 [Nocardioides hankookensis]|uniref:Ig-like domain-containing protein n=1 Tax=Nocardioides hankookensis TaxID=443157 RepID=A0ABW1LI41_9ACTN